MAEKNHLRLNTNYCNSSAKQIVFGEHFTKLSDDIRDTTEVIQSDFKQYLYHSFDSFDFESVASCSCSIRISRFFPD